MGRAALLGSALMAAAAAAAEPAGPGSVAGARTRNVAVVLYEGVEVLDFAGPAEVFAAASGYAGLVDRPAFHTYTVSATKDPVLSQGFVRVTPEFSVEDAPRPDVLVIPGGSTGRLLDDPRFMAWAAKAIGEAEITLTVCTGAFVAAKVGALDGRTATTWYNAVDRLRQAAPRTTVQEGRRFVDNGPVVTTAGVSAGIDGALHVVARLVGRSAADRTARYMEYHWSPESYLAKGYSHLNPGLDEAGRAVQQALLLEDERRFDQAEAAWRALVAADAGNAFAWLRLGGTLHSLKRYDEAVAAAQRASSSPALRPRALYGVACSRAQQGRKEDALRALDEAIQAGFKARSHMQADPELEPIRADARFQELLSRI